MVCNISRNFILVSAFLLLGLVSDEGFVPQLLSKFFRATHLNLLSTAGRGSPVFFASLQKTWLRRSHPAKQCVGTVSSSPTK